MKNQRGIGVFGIFVVGAMVVCSAILLMKLVPAYLEYFSVKKALATMAKDPELKSMTTPEIKKSFQRRADVDNITSVKGDDIEVSKSGGIPVVSVSYSVKIPIVANLSAWIDFNSSTAPE